MTNIKDHAREIQEKRLKVASRIFAAAQQRLTAAMETWKMYSYYQGVEHMKKATENLFSAIQEEIKGMTSVLFKNDLENMKRAQALRFIYFLSFNIV